MDSPLIHSNFLRPNIFNQKLTFGKKVRLILSLFAILLYYLINQTDIILNKSNIEKGKCFLDGGFTLTKGLIKIYRENKNFNKASKIIGSFILDLTFVASLIIWCLIDKLWSNGLTIVFFYVCRGIMQSLNRMSIPKDEGWEWEDPHFPSISVNYYEGNDFFWSGHVGICAICGFFAYYRKHYYFSIFSFSVALYEAILVIESRIHYTIDVPIGFFFAHYSCILVEYWCKCFDESQLKKKIFYKKINEKRIFPKEDNSDAHEVEEI